MRYNHLNPQHQYLIDKIEEQEKKIKYLEEYYNLTHDAMIVAIDRLELYREQVRGFERLPWYKKMFHKFKI